MARTTKSDVLIPEIFTQAIQAEFAQKGIFKGSMLVNMGAAVADGSFGGGASAIGETVKVPYFGTMGDFEENIADGTAATPKKISQTEESCTVVRDTLAFEVTRWGQNAKGGDAYVEAARQVVMATQRAMDKRLITAAASVASGLTKSVFSTSAPKTLDYDLLVDGLTMWGDEQDDVVGMVVHSRVLSDLYKLRDANGNPFLTQMQDGGLPRFMGIPVGTSDRCPVTGSAMGSVTETGTTPPDIAVTTNTPLGAWDLKILPVTAGARGTATIKFSVDGGINYSAPILTAASIPLVDTAVDSLVGVNGATGLTISYENASSNADNVWTAKAQLKATTLLLRRNALAFWFNQAALSLQTDRDILVDSDVGAVHLYAAALRYRRRPGGTKPGVVVLQHNVGGY
jgi:hypothetical protein